MALRWYRVRLSACSFAVSPRSRAARRRVPADIRLSAEIQYLDAPYIHHSRASRTCCPVTMSTNVSTDDGPASAVTSDVVRALKQWSKKSSWSSQVKVVVKDIRLQSDYTTIELSIHPPQDDVESAISDSDTMGNQWRSTTETHPPPDSLKGTIGMAVVTALDAETQYMDMASGKATLCTLVFSKGNNVPIVLTEQLSPNDTKPESAADGEDRGRTRTRTPRF